MTALFAGRRPFRVLHIATPAARVNAGARRAPWALCGRSVCAMLAFLPHIHPAGVNYAMARLENAATLFKGLADKQSRKIVLNVLRAMDSAPSYECSCCGYVGKFEPFGRPMLFNVFCPACDSFARHRLLWMMQKRHGLLRAEDRVLHFAPEPVLAKLVREVVKDYVSADLRPGAADMVLNIERIDLPDASFDTAICSHVLEHVDDAKALRELKRILKPGGRLLLMVPMIEGWDTSYEDPSIVDEAGRELHFGQDDHVRLYGRDFRDRVRGAGFDLVEYTSTGAEVVKHGLEAGERIFIATKPAA
jgi:SAM-dependent methyltransferase